MAATETVSVIAVLEYPYYEKLPRRIRQAIRYGPYDYAICSIWKLWNTARSQGMSVREFVERLQRKQRKDMRREILAAYGPDHPQLRRRKQR